MPGYFYQWKCQYCFMEATDVKRLKEQEEENARLKKMFGDLSLDHSILKEVIDLPVKNKSGNLENLPLHLSQCRKFTIFPLHSSTSKCKRFK